MGEIVALAVKDLRVLLRDKVGFFFAFIFPVLYASLFGAIMSGLSDGGESRRMRIALVDEDRSEGSAEFAAQLVEAPEFDVWQTDRAQATEAVRKGSRAAYVILPPGFGEARRRMFWGQPPRIETGIDPVRRAEAGLLQGMLTAMLFEGMQKAFTDPAFMGDEIDEALAQIQAAEDMDPLTKATLGTFLPALQGFVANMPAGEMGSNAFQAPTIEVTDISVQRADRRIRSAYNITFPQGIAWAIMGCAAGFGISLVVERTRGTLVRLRIAPISRSQILAGKGLACLLTTLVVATMLLVFARLVFGVRPDSVLLLAMAVLSVALCFVGIMMLLSVLGKTEQSAGGIGWAILTVMAMVGGGMMPLFFMPDWMQTISSVSPVKWSILAIEGAIWRGFSFAEMLKPCGILLAIGLLCYVIGARAFRWTDG